VSSRRTKTLLCFSALLPPAYFVGGVPCVMTYPHYLSHETHFVTFHFHWARVLALSAALFLFALISFFLDQQHAVKK